MRTMRRTSPSVLVLVAWMLVLGMQVQQIHATPQIIQKIIDAWNKALAAYDEARRNRNADVDKDLVGQDSVVGMSSLSPTPVIIPSSSPTSNSPPPTSTVVTTTLVPTCPEVDWTDSFCPTFWDPYVCLDGQCTYGNDCEASLTTLDVAKDCVPKCPKVEWEACDHTNDGSLSFTCDDDCYYINECEIELAGFDMSDCTVR